MRTTVTQKVAFEPSPNRRRWRDCRSGGRIVGILSQRRRICERVSWSEPAVIDPGPIGGPPSDAIVLFDGKVLRNGTTPTSGGSKTGTQSPTATTFAPSRRSAIVSCTSNGQRRKRS